MTNIGGYAFCKCRILTSVTIPNSVTSILHRAFTDCKTLTSIKVDAANSAYCDIDGVLFNKDKTTLVSYPVGKTAASYTIPNSVTSIEELAFYHCYRLTSVTIPNSVTSIEELAFNLCSSLTSIICEAVNPPALDKEVFYNVDKSIPLYVPAGSVEAYKAADQWKDFNVQAIPGTRATIVWKNADGAVLEMDTDVPYGITPEYNGATPAKPSDTQYTYTFAGWNDGTNTYGADEEVPAVTGNVTYTAIFTATPKVNTTYIIHVNQDCTSYMEEQQ